MLPDGNNQRLCCLDVRNTSFSRFPPSFGDSPTETYHPSSIKSPPRNYCCQQDSNNIMQRATSRSALRPFVRPSSQSTSRTASHEDKQSSKLFDQSTAGKKLPIDQSIGNTDRNDCAYPILTRLSTHAKIHARTHDADRAFNLWSCQIKME